MRTGVQDDLTIGSESSFITPAKIDSMLNRVYVVVAGMFLWPETEDAKKTSTCESETPQEYYDYPQNWRPDSIWKITVDGEDLGNPLVFEDYLYETENSFPSGKKTIWGTQWRRFFITIDGSPPSTVGNNNISVWGQKIVTKMTVGDDTGTTIFSYSLPEVNEAIVMEAVARFRKKSEEDQSAVLVSAEAKAIITNAWSKIQKSQDKYRKTKPFFIVPNFFGRAIDDVKKRIGEF